MRVVLLGDSHLAHVRRKLDLIGSDVLNAAVGGASVRALSAQATGAQVSSGDVVVVSIGTNDAAPSKQLPLPDFSTILGEWVGSLDVGRWVFVTPPGVDEARLQGAADRTNKVIGAYRDAAVGIFEAVGAHVVHADQVLERLGPGGFADDGLHLTGRAYDLLLPAVAVAAA
ncbi:hypothetical protein NPS01_11400 [Nocardioides psychrotolerans]|uniref:GDSL-like Lipase/Acylhydrolase family protein n=1 Tax=Nocardioides psychrotolerans TaxID=1005945 RepID=A0A1I3E7U7_9ACTN|nr:GDSL-type esterase/lipase family protein [Nocardioides psychrotolerans]GEP37477.1 hypothetical protein NPS01_11400 [Nocardioides psychrotolerans]SFH95035.1 GDSL-like Lipase/Acylhydrolase family protein [Nocardioides psychrotolerans]